MRDKLAKDVGISPSRKFRCRERYTRLDNPPISVGRLPARLLLPKSSQVRLERAPMDVGKVPFSWFALKSLQAYKSHTPGWTYFKSSQEARNEQWTNEQC